MSDSYFDRQQYVIYCSQLRATPSADCNISHIAAGLSNYLILIKELVSFHLADGYTTNDIIYEWGPTGAVVGNNEMAQFEYKSNNISSSIDEFSVGKLRLKSQVNLVV